MRLLIQNGRVIDPSQSMDRVANLLIDEGRIVDYDVAPRGGEEIIEAAGKIVAPGLIDIHVHLSQYRIRGAYEPSLLSWLERHVFPEEARSADPQYARALSDEFFRALFTAGTTTSVIYTAPFHQACEIAFASAQAAGARAFIGMTMMDRISPANLLQTTDYAWSRSVELYER